MPRISSRLRKRIKSLLPSRRIGTLRHAPDSFDRRDVYKDLNPDVWKSGKYSLGRYCPKVLDQGKVGACTGYASVYAYYILTCIRNDKYALLANPLYTYALARTYSGWPDEDKGAYLRSAVKSMTKDGLIPKHGWVDDWRELPTAAVIRTTRSSALRGYERIAVNSLAPQYMMNLISEENLPILIGVAVFSNWSSKKTYNTGEIAMPGAKDTHRGGHAMCLYGYDESKQVFYGINSWGEDWGNNGHFSIPFSYFTSTSTCHDIWTFSTEY